MSDHKQNNDPYVYPFTSVLINKFNLRDEKALQEVEGVIFALKNADPLPDGNLDYSHLKAIHQHFFGDIYEWAGQERTVDPAKGNSYNETNSAHPFREGNGRTQRVFLQCYCRKVRLSHRLDAS